MPSGCVHQRLDPLMSFSSLRSDHLGRTIIQKHREQTKYRQSTKHKQEASQLSPEKESRVTAAFQGGAFSPFSPGSNCLFSSLVVLCPRFFGVAAVEEMSANVFVFFARSVGEEIFPPWFEPTPSVKMPEAVVRPWSHVPTFGWTLLSGRFETSTS